MAEYISREAVLKRLNDFNEWCKDGRLQGALFAADVIKDIPAADVQPVKHGRWELTDNPSFRKCSECGAWWSSDITDNCFTKYCPKCGARMEQEG